MEQPARLGSAVSGTTDVLLVLVLVLVLVLADGCGGMGGRSRAGNAVD